MSKESQRKVKGKGNECLLAFYLQDKGRILASYNTQNFIWHFEENKKGFELNQVAVKLEFCSQKVPFF